MLITQIPEYLKQPINTLNIKHNNNKVNIIKYTLTRKINA